MASADAFDIMLTPVLCAGDSTGAVEVLNLSTNDFVFQQAEIPAGNFIFPLTIADGCVIQEEVLIEEPLPFILVVDSILPSCFESNNGSAVVHGLDGTAPYTGLNDFGSLAMTNLAPGVYSDTIADANGCAAAYSFEIIEIPEAIIEVTSPNWVCAGGWVIFDAIVSGVGTSYFWDIIGPGIGLGAGTQSFSVVDSNLCVTSIDVTIQEIPSPAIDATISAESVSGLGNIALNVTGNYAPYTATWPSGFVGLNYSELAQGNYAVSITDSLGCTTDTTFAVFYNFINDEIESTEFIVDWKSGQLRYVGTERLKDVEIFNSTGQLLVSKSTWGKDEIVHLTISTQVIFVSSSRGSFRSKVILR
jgi:hypothetical protein